MDKEVERPSKGVTEFVRQPVLQNLPFNWLKSQVPIGQDLPFERMRDERWDFRGVPASSGVYGIHPYPAMLHFMVARQLVSDYSKSGDLVLDPFLGSGVTAAECLASGRDFAGCDINPLAVLIAKVRTTPIVQKKLLEALHSIEEKYHKNMPECVEFPNIEYWFDEKAIRNLARLKKAVCDFRSEKIKDFFKVAFSETVRRVSKTEYGEFKLLRKKNDNQSPDVLKTFRDVAAKNIMVLSHFFLKQPHGDARGRLCHCNIKDGMSLGDGSVDMVITSPPYGDSKTTVAYGQFSRLSLRWLGIEEKVDRDSLGGKAVPVTKDLPSTLLYEYVEKINSKDAKRAREVFSFYKDLFDSINVIAVKVKIGGYACLVVGNRRVKGFELPTDKITVDFFGTFGFEHQKTIVRAISNKRMPNENAPSNVKGEKDSTMRYEYIVILKRLLRKD